MAPDRLLDSLLRSLLTEWSRDEIVGALDALEHSGIKTSQPYRDERSVKRQSRPKPSAYELAQKVDAPSDLKEVIIGLARRYDEKEFLPNIGDVRHFLEMGGKDSSNIRQRPDAFRRVINLLLDAPEEYLHKIFDQGFYSGPSDLRSLAEAIKQTGEDLRSRSLQK